MQPTTGLQANLPDKHKGRAMNQELIEAAMDELENYPAGGIGKSGPTLDELDEHVELTGCAWEGDNGYHVVQRAWRILEKWMSQTTGLTEVDQ
jgi:hypothetical protein